MESVHDDDCASLGSVARAVHASPLGPFILHFTFMGLDCYPKRCPCPKHARSQRDDIPDGFTHRKDKPCPFDGDALPKGIFGSCCWLRGKEAARELEALGESSIADRLYEDMTAEEARDFATELHATADRLTEQHAKEDTKPRGAGWNGVYDLTTKETAWENYSTFEEAIAAVRTAASWYAKVSERGFGVHAWY